MLDNTGSSRCHVLTAESITVGSPLIGAPALAGRRRHTTSKKAVEHFLLSIALDRCAHAHLYLMTDDRRYLDVAADRLLTEAEKLGCSPLTGLMLATPLTADVALVRDIISKRSADAEQLLRTATDFHWTLFVTCADDPADEQLMRMH